MNWDLIIRIIATAAIAYLLGSFSFAIIFTRANSDKDIREMGSGNAGFTNVLRSVGVGPAVLTITFDFIKGVVAVLIGWWIFSGVHAAPDVAMYEYTHYGRYLAGVFAMVGHSYPLYFGFKGGKGIVTAAALMSVVDFRVFLMIIATFLIMVLITRIVSLSSLTCAALYPIYTCLIIYFCDYLPSIGGADELRLRFVWICTGCAFVVGLFAILKHTENIKRLLAGEEKSIKPKKKQ